jgi:hypothetical protein
MVGLCDVVSSKVLLVDDGRPLVSEHILHDIEEAASPPTGAALAASSDAPTGELRGADGRPRTRSVGGVRGR